MSMKKRAALKSFWDRSITVAYVPVCQLSSPPDRTVNVSASATAESAIGRRAVYHTDQSRRIVTQGVFALPYIAALHRSHRLAT